MCHGIKQYPFKVFIISVNYFEGIVFCGKIY
ncbi:hypothetical protein ACGCJ4_15080, partial [Staphylococcus aureus]